MKAKRKTIAVFFAGVLVGLLLAAIVVLSILGYIISGDEPRTSEVLHAMEAQIEIGMTRDDVDTILSASGIEYGWSDKAKQYYMVEQYLYRKGFVHYGEQLVVTVDDQGFVSNVEIRSVATGP